MAKGMHYFKFIATEWLTGDIVYEDYAVQGLFINICALYWQRDGKLTLDDIEKRYKSDLIAKLSDRFFSVTDRFISIKFLDEQLVEANHISMKNSENGKLGGRPKGSKTLEKKATAKRPLSDRKAKKSQLKENKIELEIEIEKEEDYSFSLPRNSENESLVLEKKSITSESVIAENEVEEIKATPLPPSAPSLYASCMEVYNNFILEDTGVPAKIDGQQGKALKSIIQYLKTASNDKSDQGIIDSWKFILAYKSRWEPFHQKQITLSQINSNLINILSSIKNPNKNVKSNSVYNSSKYREA